MALVLADRVRDTTTTTGTGTVTLSGTAPTGYQNFSVIGNANTTYYTINAGSQWEVGIGTYSATGPTLSRDTVLESSNANALVNFSAGTKDVFVTYPSDRAVTTDGVETLTNKTINGSNNTITNVSLTTAVTGTLPVANGGTGVTTSTGTTSVVLSNSPVLVTPTLGAASATSIANGLGAVGTPSYAFTGDLNTGMWSPGTDTVAFSTNGAERMRLDSSGNVGIGTSSPDANAKLDVAGTVRSGAGGSDPGTGAVFYLVGSGSFQTVIGGAAFAVNTGANNARTERMRIASDGTTTLNVGGVSSTHQFNYNESGGEIQLIDSTGAGPILLDNMSGLARLYKVGTGAMSIGTTGENYLQYVTNSAERMRIDSSGNVGIGTTAPLGRLQAVGSAYFGAGPSDATNATLAAYSDGTGISIEAFQGNSSATKRNMWLAAYGGNVGIGTTAPGASTRLNVNGRGLFTGGSYDPGDSTASGVSISYDTGSNIGIIGAIQTGVTEREMRMRGNTLTFFTNGANERMRVTDTGNVGIGTTTPLARLFAQAPTGAGAAFSYIGNANGAYPSDVFGGSFGYNFSAGGAEVDFWNGWTGATGTQGGFAFRRQTGASSQNLLMTIRGDGNVGIGTSSPLYQATVLGLGQETAALTDAGNKGGSLYLQATGITSGSGGAVLFGTTFGNQTPFAAIKGLVTDGATNTIGDLAFSTRNATSDTALTERMRILRAGNVGIGTSAPQGLLHVVAGTDNSILVRGPINYATGGSIYAVNSANSAITPMEFGASSYFFAGGNVGIGTSSPGAKLDVTTASGANIVVSRSSAAGYAAFQRIAPAGQFTYDFYTINGVEAARITVTDTNIMAFATGSAATERMRIDSSGNVGIGTSAPASLLHVKRGSNAIEVYPAGTWATRAINATDGSGENGLLVGNRWAGTGSTVFEAGSIYGGGTGSWYSYYRIDGTGQSIWSNGGTERMRLDTSGNVGIGTSSPSFKLDIQGSSAQTARVYCTDSASGSYAAFNAANANGVSSVMYSYSGAGWYGTTSNHPTLFLSNNAERMRIDSAGLVGIGTSSPAYLLHLNQNGNTQAWISATNAGSNSAGVGFENQGQRNWQIWADRTNDALQFGNNSRATTNMVITSAGNVGIGTTSPVQRLHVRQDQNGTTAALIQNRNGTGSPASALQFISGAFDLSDNRYAMISSAGGSNTTLQFWTGEGAAPAERMRITSAGNVGIGTSSPAAKFQIDQNQAAISYLDYNNTTNGGGVVWRQIVRNIANSGTTSVDIAKLTGGAFFINNNDTNAANFTAFGVGASERMRIDSSGNVGIGTSSPGTKLDVVGDIRCTNSMFLGAGQNLDNKIEIGSGRTGSNYAYIDLIGDTTYTDYGLRLIRGNGGANTTSQLVHRGTGDMYITTQDAATMYFQTNNTTRMYIEAGGTMQMNGSLLVGRSSASTDVNTANDTGSFSVRGNGTTIASMSFHRTGAYAINMGLGTDNVFRIGGWSASSNCFQMDGSGNLTMLGNVTAYSDARIKKDVETIDSALDLVSKMRGVRYTRIDTKKRGVGVIAQEMLEVCPEVVQQGVGDDDTLSVAYGNLVGVLIEAVKELTARVAELEGK